MPKVLLSGVEPEDRERYLRWLGDKYIVRTAAIGQETLDELDYSIDVLLLDCDFQDPFVEQVANKIDEENYNCRCAMILSTEPDIEISNLNFHSYVAKPVARGELESLVENLITIAEYVEYVQEMHSLASEKANLESGTDQLDLESNPKYKTLEYRIKFAEKEASMSYKKLSNNNKLLYRDLDS